MTDVGQAERETQNRVIDWFKNQLGYDYLGDWQYQARTSPVEDQQLSAYLQKQSYSPELIGLAVTELKNAASSPAENLYELNKAVYGLLRYGIPVQGEHDSHHTTVHLIDWKAPHKNHFAIAEEVTITGEHTKRPDLVLYVNGIALCVLELKKSSISISKGIRQNLLNQEAEFIRPFFATVQLVMAGNDSQGIRYGTIETKEKYYLSWKEPSDCDNRLQRHLSQLCEKTRLLEIVHDFVLFDGGIKKLPRPHQYFGVKAAQERIRRREGGIIWHTQGSGKSLTMVWLTKWIKEFNPQARVLIITDREELDGQIETVFQGVNEQIYRTKSCHDLIQTLNGNTQALICTLIHKFGRTQKADYQGFIDQLKHESARHFNVQGDIYAFIDECHRTQSGDLHKAMKRLLPNALFIGFTGTPLLKKDKQHSIAVFGSYIHTYKFNEGVADRVVLDLRYEARKVELHITSKEHIDKWFEARTQGLTEAAKNTLKQRWGTLQKVLSSKDRLGNVRGQYKSDHHLYTASLTRGEEDTHSAQFALAGGIAALREGVFFGRPITDSFAVVHLENSDKPTLVKNNSVTLMETDDDTVLLPEFSSYSSAEIGIQSKQFNNLKSLRYSLDDASQPLVITRRAGAYLDLKIKRFFAVEGNIYIRNSGSGKEYLSLLPLEYTAEGKTEESFSGEKGYFYLEKVSPGPQVLKLIRKEGNCEAAIDIPDPHKSLLKLGEIECVRK